MSRSEDIIIPEKTWTQITNADVTAITFQNKSGGTSMHVQATVGETPPTTVDGAKYPAGAGEWGLPLYGASFGGVSGANRVWVYSVSQIEVFVSHA